MAEPPPLSTTLDEEAILNAILAAIRGSSNGDRGVEDSSDSGVGEDERKAFTFEEADVKVSNSSLPSLLNFTVVEQHPQYKKSKRVSVRIAIRHGSGGPRAGIHRALLLRAYAQESIFVLPLVSLVKQWGNVRQLRNSQEDTRNSQEDTLSGFTLTLMAIFFLQTTKVVNVLDCSPAAIQARFQQQQKPTPRLAQKNAQGESSHRLSVVLFTEPHPRSAAQSNKMLHSLLQGFFDYWRQFNYEDCAPSVRLGTVQDRTGRNQDRSDAAAPTGHSTAGAFVVEDPCEPDANIACASSSWHLETLRGELNRAAETTRSQQGWCEVCRDDGKKRGKIMAWMLPALASTRRSFGIDEMQHAAELVHADAAGSKSVDQRHGTIVLGDAIAAFDEFVENGESNSFKRIPYYLDAEEIQSIGHLAKIKGIVMKRCGKQEAGNSGYMVQLWKRVGWVDTALKARPPAWTPESTRLFRVALGLKNGAAKGHVEEAVREVPALPASTLPSDILDATGTAATAMDSSSAFSYAAAAALLAQSKCNVGGGGTVEGFTPDELVTLDATVAAEETDASGDREMSKDADEEDSSTPRLRQNPV